MSKSLSNIVKSYYPDDFMKASELSEEILKLVTKKLQTYANFEYSLYKQKNDSEMLGRSLGADDCIKIINELLDNF